MSNSLLLNRSWLLVWLCASSLSRAAETSILPDSAGTAESPGWLNSAGGWLELQRDSFSETVKDSAEGIDAYLARESFDHTLLNESYLKVHLRQRLEKSGAYSFDANIRAKLKLPNSRRKLKLTFDSDPDDFESIADKNRNQLPGFNSSNTLKDTAIAGLSVDKMLGKRWHRSYNLGIRLKLPLNPYARVNWTHAKSWSEYWQSRFKQSFGYFHTDGWKSETGLSFYRPLNERLLFQSSSGAQFLDKDNNWELYQGLSLHQRLSVDSAFEHQVGVSGLSRPSMKTNGYWLRTELRHRLHKDWLFAKVSPELYFGRVDGFTLAPSITFELEIYFGKAPD
tara:strand:- start:621 stop:1634 length:1014 start_codon:yes stop_codon:yes gene_type:complete